MKALFIFLSLLVSICSLGQNREIDSLKSLLPVQSNADKISSLNELSWHYRSINIDTAISLAEQAIAISNEIQNTELLGRSLNNLGAAYQATGSYDTAIVILSQSLDLISQVQDSSRLSSILNNLGICYDELGQYNKALSNYFDGLRIAEDQADLEKEALIIGNIGIVYKKMKSYSKVLEYYQQALDIYTTLDNTLGVTIMTGNIASVYIQLKEFELAIEYSFKAKNLYEQLGYLRYVPYSVGNAAIASDSLNNKNAEALYLESIAAHEQFDNQYELAFQYKNLASYYIKQHKLSLAELYAKKAIDAATAIQANEMIKDALAVASLAAFESENFKQAYLLQKEMEEIKDSLYEKSKTRQIFELQTQYETEKKEHQIALQNARINEQETANERNIAIIFGLVIGLMLLILLVIAMRSRSRKKHELLKQEAEIKLRKTQIEAAISSQEKERTRFAKDLHDGFGQMISILNLNLKSLEDGDKDKHEVFESSSKVLEEMYQELKGICFNLMPQTLIKHGITSAINEFAGRINNTGKYNIETDFFGMEERLTDVQEISLYRITQEWVNNILKYSDASKVTVQITRDEEEITLLIEDDGSGFDLNVLKSGKGNGWKNMNSRANLINGELEVETSPGMRGNTLIVNAPILIEKPELQLA